MRGRLPSYWNAASDLDWREAVGENGDVPPRRLSTACPKPARGTLRALREAKRQRVRAEELRAKAECRRRDGDRCRWPGCTETTRIESAHLIAKSLGGLNDRQNLVRLCEAHHRGPVSLHSGDLRIEPLTERGADGPLLFLRRDEAQGWCADGCEDGR